MSKLAVGTILNVKTSSRVYTIKVLNPKKGEILISGHPQHCPEPTPAIFIGATVGGSMIKNNHIVFDQRMEIILPHKPEGHQRMTTSCVENIELISPNE